MRKILIILIALVATTALWAYDFQSGDLYYRITSDFAPYTVEVTHEEQWSSNNYTGLTTATIPKTVTYNGTTYSVTRIGDYAFSGCTVNKVVINNSALDIIKGSTTHGYVAYYASDVYVGNDTVGDFIFAKKGDADYVVVCLGNDCQITLPENYRGKSYGIGTNLFCNNTAVKSITISNGVTSIGAYAFSGCSNLNVVYIGNSVITNG